MHQTPLTLTAELVGDRRPAGKPRRLGVGALELLALRRGRERCHTSWKGLCGQLLCGGLVGGFAVVNLAGRYHVTREGVSKLTWLVLGGDPAVRSRRVEQFTAL
jgi:hypothetical protein